MRHERKNLLASAGVTATIFFLAIHTYAQPADGLPVRSLLVRPAIAQEAGTPASTAPLFSEGLPSPILQTAATMQQPVIDEGVSAPSSLPAPEAIISSDNLGMVTKALFIKYDTDRDARRMYASGGVSLVMVTQNPADHCVYEIPLCIPACVGGEPTMHGYCGLHGRGVVEYCWPCGFEVKVKFRNVGDIRVDYEGD